ncbi:serine/threonine-protein kinase 4-like isoform X2, partial [Biomphalaria pfeifferi]
SKNLTLFSSDINTDGGKLINSQSELIGFRPLLKLKLDEDLNLLLQRLARLTVKLKIKYTSPHRPEKFNVTQTACYKSCPRFGTGLITFCFNQGGKEGYIKIATDSMNVFDETEAIKTECILNYDDYDSEIIVLNDCTFINKKNEPGITELMFSFVDEYIDCYSDIRNLRQVIDKLSETFYSNIIYMVSHPQGLPKHVSIGIITNEEPASSGTDSTLPFNSKYYEDGVIPGIRGAPIYQSGHKVRYNNGMGYKTDHNVFLTADFASKNIFWQKLIEEVD